MALELKSDSWVYVAGRGEEADWGRVERIDERGVFVSWYGSGTKTYADASALKLAATRHEAEQQGEDHA